METKNLQNKLNNMIGGTYLYNTREVRIRDIAAANGQVKFITDGHPIVIEKSQLKQKLDDFLPMEEETEVTLPAEIEDNAMQTLRHTDDKMAKLEAIIMNNIEKVQQDREYLPQANQVNKDVNTILKMNQQKIHLFREVRKTKLNAKF